MKRLIIGLMLVMLLLVPVACARAPQAIPAEAPAMAAGVSNHIWTIEEIVSLVK